MNRLWVKLIRRGKIAAQDTIECPAEDHRRALIELCKRFDAPAPIWLKKHEREFADGYRTAFAAEHFMEAVAFDRMEIEYLPEGGANRKSDDPRNA